MSACTPRLVSGLPSPPLLWSLFPAHRRPVSGLLDRLVSLDFNCLRPPPASRACHHSHSAASFLASTQLISLSEKRAIDLVLTSYSERVPLTAAIRKLGNYDEGYTTYFLLYRHLYSNCPPSIQISPSCASSFAPYFFCYHFLFSDFQRGVSVPHLTHLYSTNQRGMVVLRLRLT